MTPLECERIFERIEEYKRSIEKYIQDVASLVEKVAYVQEEDPFIEPAEVELHEEGVDMGEGAYNNEDLVDFLIETFDLNL